MLSKFQCRFRKGFNAQHCLLLMVEKRGKVPNNSGETGACINHNLIEAKHKAQVVKKN